MKLCIAQGIETFHSLVLCAEVAQAQLETNSPSGAFADSTTRQQKRDGFYHPSNTKIRHVKRFFVV